MMRREDLVPIFDYLIEHVVQRPIPRAEARSYCIRTTSGTSGKGPLVVVSQHGDRVYRTDSGKSNALLLANGARGIRMANLLYAWNITDGPVRVLSCGGVSDMNHKLAALIDDFRPDMIKGTLSTVLQITEGSADETREGVSVLRIAGELYTPSYKRLVTARFPRAITALTYLSAEMGVIGVARCGFLSSNHYHPEKGVVVTIVDMDGEGVGEISVSKDVYPGVLVEDYRTGDVGRLVEKPCACGQKVTFEVLGRAGYDYVKVAGMVIRRDAVERALASVQHCFSTYRAYVSAVRVGDTYRGQLEIVLFREAGVLSLIDIQTITSVVGAELQVTPTLFYRELVSKKLCMPLKVSCTNLPFPVSNKTLPLSYVGEVDTYTP